MRNNYFRFFMALLMLAGIRGWSQTININVVFHVVYKTTAQNIPDSCLQDQLDVLNEDFNAQNADLWKVPAAWTPIIGNMNVHFAFATVDPNGNPTTGIERRQTTVSSWTNNYAALCSYAGGGLDAWPDTAYLNVWVCNFGNGVISEGQLPGGPAATDGIYIHYQAVGRGSYAISPYNLGRAGTHAVGHWLGLRHFGPTSNCSDLDNIPDTPPYSMTNLYGGYTPGQVVTDACNPSAPGVMWMNFMTSVYDSSMYFFTQDQVDTMTWVYNNLRVSNGGPTSTGAMHSQQLSVNIYPSPSSDGIFTLQLSAPAEKAIVTVYNTMGETVEETQLAANEKTHTMDLSFLPCGFYTVAIIQNGQQEIRRIVIAR